MFLKLRIVFTILAAASIAIVLPVGALWGWGWAGCCGLVAALFFGLMLLCKQKQEELNPPTQDVEPLPTPDSDHVRNVEANESNSEKDA